MPDPSSLPREKLERGRDLGGVTYLTCYIRLMMHELSIPETDKKGINDMMLKMVEPLNVATEAIWRALMEDDRGMREAFERFEGMLNKI